MRVIPAIDILNGKTVRLYQGRYDMKTEYAMKPVEQAKIFEAQGAKRIHVVDLDGAKEGRATNFDSIRAIRKNVSMEIEVGGGIRNEETIARYVEIGVEGVILGTKALTDRDFLKKAIGEHGDTIIVGLDVKDNAPAVCGWCSTVEMNIPELFKEFESIGVGSVIYTDIASDGTLKGVDIERLKETLRASNIPIILSGGVSSIDDIIALYAFHNPQLKGVIVGKAFYDGRLSVEEALRFSE